MNEDWWPDLLRHIPEERPWNSLNVTVAEVRSFDDPWFAGERRMWSAMVPSEIWKGLAGHLSAFGSTVESTGRPAVGSGDFERIDPKFWIGARAGETAFAFEPLVLSWENNNRTPLVLDPRFAMTYGLVPRALGDGTVHWDNPAEPEYDVAVIDPPSLYEDLRHGDARAVVSRDYLQDYLTLRGMELVQVFYESRRGEEDAQIEALLGDREMMSEIQRSREIDVRRRREGGYLAQIWGARHIAGADGLPVSANPLETAGLTWPGDDQPVTMQTAQRKRMWDHVYVKDGALAAYEGKPEFSVSPESGHIGLGNQWSVGPTERVGRDLIRFEIRKLYEGTPHRVVQHLHSFAVKPSEEEVRAGRRSRNVGGRAKEIALGMADIGTMLCGIAAMFGLEPRGPAEFVGLDRMALERHHWWCAPFVEPITRHIPLAMTRSEFLARCLQLDKVTNEAFAQKRLRPLLEAFGPQRGGTHGFRGLRLLDRIVCLCQVGLDAGLAPWKAGAAVVARYESDGTEPARPLTKLFALRQIAGHRKHDDADLSSALARFGLSEAATVGGWGSVMDSIYDQLSTQLKEIHGTFVAAMRIGV